MQETPKIINKLGYFLGLITLLTSSILLANSSWDNIGWIAFYLLILVVGLYYSYSMINYRITPISKEKNPLYYRAYPPESTHYKVFIEPDLVFHQISYTNLNVNLVYSEPYLYDNKYIGVTSILIFNDKKEDDWYSFTEIKKDQLRHNQYIAYLFYKVTGELNTKVISNIQDRSLEKIEICRYNAKEEKLRYIDTYYKTDFLDKGEQLKEVKRDKFNLLNIFKKREA